MVLTKEDAVYGWRSLMGNTDPAEAKEKAPDRLLFKLCGYDIDHLHLCYTISPCQSKKY